MPTAEVRKQRKQKGLCPSCGGPNDRSVSRCSTCALRRVQDYHNCREKGICTEDGCGRPATHGKLCGVHRTKMKIRNKRKRRKLRDDTFAAYGGYKCACPGCTCTTPEFMQLDHINNDGSKHRRELFGNRRHGGQEIYYWLKKNNYPPIVQPMCANCNFAKGHYGNCPLAGTPH